MQSLTPHKTKADGRTGRAGGVHNAAGPRGLRAARQLEVAGAGADDLAHLQPLARGRAQLLREAGHLRSGAPWSCDSSGPGAPRDTCKTASPPGRLQLSSNMRGHACQGAQV